MRYNIKDHSLIINGFYMEAYKDNNCNLYIIDREKKILFSAEGKWWEYPWWFDKQYYDDDIDINTVKSAIDRLKDIFDSSWIIEERIRIIQDAEKFFRETV